jgi:hypothetical protein
VVKQYAVRTLSTETIKAITERLPEPLSDRRRQLLPKVLREWIRTDLPDRLWMESREITNERIRRMEVLKRCAGQLMNALNAIEENDRTAIIAQMIIAEGRRQREISRTDFDALTRRLDEELHFLARLAAISPKQYWNVRRGRPRNVPAYFVLQDAAEVFEWFSGRKPTREVDRIEATETGPFFRFASILWPVVFGRGAVGLPAAMKNWGLARLRYRERSPVIANINLRHPAWGVFER